MTNIPPQQQWGKVIAGCVMSITPTDGKTNYLLGEPIAIKTTLKNVGTNPVPIIVTYPFYRFQAHVIFTNKEPLPLSAYGNSVGPTAAVSLVTLLPKEAITTCSTIYYEYINSDYPLSKMFDLGSPGVYRVVMSRELFDVQSGKNVTGFSNELLITIGN